MERLGNAEERLVAFDDIPRRVNSEVTQQRDHAGQDLSHPAADRRRVDVLEPPVTHTIGQHQELVDYLRPDDLAVVLETIAHAGSSVLEPSRTISRRSSSSVRT